MPKPARVHTRLDPESRKLLLIQATLKALTKYGFQGTSVRRICEEANVSVGLINHHYNSKDELVAETYLHVSRSLHELLASAVRDAGPDPREQIAAFFKTSFSPEMLDPQLLEAWIAFWGAIRASPTLAAAREASNSEYRLLLSTMLKGLAKQHRWTAFDSDSAALALTALLDGMWLESGLNPSNFSPAKAIQICEAWLEGLRLGARSAYRLSSAD